MVEIEKKDIATKSALYPMGTSNLSVFAEMANQFEA